MKKIGLRLDELAVDSFETGAHAGPDGTVRAQEALTLPSPCPVRTEIQTCRRDMTCTDVYHACIC
jgi:hypothetical protein